MNPHLGFTPHSWYMNFAIKKNSVEEIRTIVNNYVADNVKAYAAFKNERGYVNDDVMDRDTKLFIRTEFATVNNQSVQKWIAFTANGMTGHVDELKADTLKELKENIKQYHAAIAERDAYNRKMIGEK